MESVKFVDAKPKDEGEQTGPIRKTTTQARTQPATDTAAGGGSSEVDDNEIPF